MKNNRLRGEFLLLLTALIWGASFVAQRAGIRFIGPFTFNGVRSLLGALALLPVIFLLGRQKQTSNKSQPLPAIDKKLQLQSGLASGLVLFVASSLQQHGIVYTTAGKAGFITALYIIFVPILGLFFGRRIHALLWFAVGLAGTGLYLLASPGTLALGRGDFLVLLSAFMFAVHILVIDHYSPLVDGVKMACLQFFVSGLLSVPFMFILETVNPEALLQAWLPILYAGVLSCSVAYTLQIIAQKDTEPTVASLILSLESAFALLTGMLILKEQISSREAVGCLVMFLALILAQLAPAVRRQETQIHYPE